MPERVKVFFDGGCSGTPGRMETAVVTGGRCSIVNDLGHGTSADAEWLALIHALTVAHALATPDIVLLGDSADVIAKANGTLRGRGADLPHLDAFRRLTLGRPTPRIRWIRRSQNLAGIALTRSHDR